MRLILNIYHDLRSNPKLQAIVLFFILALCSVWADFSTKGEPREALVAMDMLHSGNWVLPIDASGDMAYKPPMFHWLVALFSLLHGHICELTSRLPSVLTLSLLFYFTAQFASQDKGRSFGLKCAFFMLTCFEVFRAGTVARVDMVLTFFLVSAIFALYYRHKTKRWCYLVVAVLCMSGGTLTKGPVAILLPLGVYWVWGVFEKCKPIHLTLECIILLIMSLLLPIVWYAAAAHQGGDRFIKLAMEENFGRFTGSMSYDSHVKPLWYNFLSLLTGTLPWCIIFLLTLFFSKVRRHIIETFKHWKNTWHRLSPQARLCLIAATVIFVFYCIPKSKRSVYLLPMYPFMAYGMAWYATKLTELRIVTTRPVRNTIIGVFVLMVAGFGIAFPLVAAKNSDRIKAQEITAIVPDGNIYTFMPDRFLRFYITNFYLDGRLVSLMPSAQVEDLPSKPDASLMRVPAESEFYMLTTSELYDTADDFGLHKWLNDNSLSAEVVYRSTSKGHDIRSYFVLLHITKN